jgi:hypothetical protein
MFISALGLCTYFYHDRCSPAHIMTPAFISLLLAFFMPNFFLGDTHNAVDGKNVAGERTADATVGTSRTPINQRAAGEEVVR